MRRHRIGFVFQFFHLLRRLDAQGNVELPMLFAGVARAERRERASRALAAVGLAARASHRPDQLSGGECQRVAIARAVVMGPSVLLADEPTGNLDAELSDTIFDLFHGLNHHGMTVLVATHDLRQVMRLGKRMVTLKVGELVGDRGARS